MSAAAHPEKILFNDSKIPTSIPAVDHYAGSEKLIHKALFLQQSMRGRFDITCDCEDGAEVGQELAHAQMCASIIASEQNQFGRIGIRIHGISHPLWREDLQQIIPLAGERLAFITLPKAGSAQDVRTQLSYIRQLEQNYQQHRPLPVHVLIETHQALQEVWHIAAIPGVESLDFGLMDFVSAHDGAIGADAMRSPGQFEHQLIRRAKTEICAAALAHGVIPSHNVCTELQDTDIIADDARRARQEFGFLRMWSIHPAQIKPILEQFQPSLTELDDACQIIANAMTANWGPSKYQGKLHDRASYRYYWMLIKRASQAGMTIAAEVECLLPT